MHNSLLFIYMRFRGFILSSSKSMKKCYSASDDIIFIHTCDIVLEQSVCILLSSNIVAA